MMNTITENITLISAADAEAALKEIAIYKKEIKKMNIETSKAIMLIKECTESEEKELKAKINILESRLKKYAEKESDFTSQNFTLPFPDGEIGFRKKIRYKSVNELRTVRSIELHLKSLSKTDSAQFNTGVKLKRQNLNKLSNETLKRLGLCREEKIEFFYKIDGFKSY